MPDNMVGAVHPNRPGDWGQSPLPAELAVWNKDVSPILFVANQAGMDRILTDVGKLLSQTFIMTKPMVEEISLPLYAGQLCSNPFIIANQLRKRVAAVNADQSVQMIWHKQ